MTNESNIAQDSRPVNWLTCAMFALGGETPEYTLGLYRNDAFAVAFLKGYLQHIDYQGKTQPGTYALVPHPEFAHDPPAAHKCEVRQLFKEYRTKHGKPQLNFGDGLE